MHPPAAAPGPDVTPESGLVTKENGMPLPPSPFGCTEAPRGVVGALREADLALGQGRHAQALRVLERGLARPPADDDLRMRLRLTRGTALWLSGRTKGGWAEVEKAAPECRQPLTRARALENVGLFAWKAQRRDAAAGWLEEALVLYRAHGAQAGAARTLGRLGGLLCDEGRMQPALERHDEAVDAAQRSARGDVLAEAHCERASLLASLGRWDAARADLAASAALFAAAGDPRQHTRVGLERAVVELAAGELGAARESLAAARAAACPEGSDPRTLGLIALLRSDLLLCVTRAEAALAEAGEALALFARVGSAEGEARSRIRMVHGLLALDRGKEALAQARRALECAGQRPDLRAVGLIAMGRVYLRLDRSQAERAFAAAGACRAGRPTFLAAARLGVALARGASRVHAEVSAALGELESWGDRRVLSLCLGALDETLGAEPVAPSACRQPAMAADASAYRLAGAAVALSAPEPWPARWAQAMKAVRPLLPWRRAALVGPGGFELRGDLEEPHPLAATDLAFALAARAAAPLIVDLAVDPALRRHPQCVLHALGAALVAPVSADRSLYVDFRQGQAVGERELALLAQLAALVARHGRGHAAEAPPADPPPPPAFAPIVGRCAAMRTMLAEAARVAGTAHTVHVLGETGTGKERLARALHQASPRAERALVAVNAASLSDELFESEMFGHVKGAFTGAMTDRRGFVAEAEGGTLFLDEVTDLSARGQAKLLRFLQEREYRRLGDPRTHRADVRIVTASNVPLEEAVAAGRFRSDLMYRLGQHVLTLPPLRERGEDLLLLARHCLRRAAEAAGTPVPALSREAAAQLLRHSWPGNVRELESEMARALVRCGGGTVRPQHLTPSLSRPARPRMPLRLAVDAFEREHIQQALQRNRGNRSHTAVELGLSRQALLGKISRLGIAAAGA
jgi:DNA-binding NtrC family response regulator/tetratricopeptide (TPR) repeat protein